jgi:hypothetical protein
MASAGLHGFIGIQSSPTVASPPVVHQKKPSLTRELPSNIELDHLAFGVRYNGPSEPGSQTPIQSGVQTPKTPNELEQSRPPSPTQHEAVGVMQGWNNPPINKWRILCCCLIYLGNGINDSGTIS